MRLGFIGTGTITAAIVRGLAASGWDTPIAVSPRNEAIALALAEEFAFVSVGRNNQAVADGSETVFIGVRPQVVAEVLSELNLAQVPNVVSLVATLSIESLRELVGQGPKLSRAVPLPFVEQQVGGTVVYPPGSVAEPIFARLGRAVTVQTPAQIDLLLAASATMGAFFATQDAVANWLVDRGVPQDMARSYMGQLVVGLAASAQLKSEVGFGQLAEEFSTRGGLNEQLRLHLQQQGLASSYRDGLDAILRRIEG